MILDKLTLFDEDLTLTVTADSTNSIDLGADGSGIQQLLERPAAVLCQITADMTAGGTSLAIAIEVDDDSAFGSATVISESEVIVAATLVAGYQFLIGIPTHISERYMQLRYTAVGTFSGGGTITAGLIIDIQTSGMQPL